MQFKKVILLNSAHSHYLPLSSGGSAVTIIVGGVRTTRTGGPSSSPFGIGKIKTSFAGGG